MYCALCFFFFFLLLWIKLPVGLAACVWNKNGASIGVWLSLKELIHFPLCLIGPFISFLLFIYSTAFCVHGNKHRSLQDIQRFGLILLSVKDVLLFPNSYTRMLCLRDCFYCIIVQCCSYSSKPRSQAQGNCVHLLTSGCNTKALKFVCRYATFDHY